MSHYTQPTHPGTTYPYTPYTYPGQTPSPYATTPYQTPYATAVTGYGATWHYPYNYYQYQQPQPAQSASNHPRPTVSTTAAAPATSNAATPVAPAIPRSTPAPTTYTFAQSYTPANVGGVSSGRGGRKQSTFKGLFAKELRNLMYGFGDDRNPANDTVNVMEEILIEYIVDVCQTALAPGKNKTRLSIEDLRRALSRPADAKKLARMEELLFMQEDIKRARAQFEESDMTQAGSLQA